MKLNNLFEARYQGKDAWVVDAFDPEEGQLDWYAGPFNSEKEAEDFASQLRAKIEKMLFDAGGENRFGRFMLDEIPRFSASKVNSPDSFEHAMITSVLRQFQV